MLKMKLPSRRVVRKPDAREQDNIRDLIHLWSTDQISEGEALQRYDRVWKSSQRGFAKRLLHSFFPA